MSALEGISIVSNLLERWDRESPTGSSVVSYLTELAKMLENATQVYYKQNRDPFDNRHPSRSYPDCTIGHMLKRIMKHATFLTTIVDSIVTGNEEVQTVSCRVLLDLLIGIDSPFFAEKEQLVSKLINFVEGSSNPLQSYATCVLAAAMEEDQVATKFKEQISNLIPIVLRRLNYLISEYCSPIKKNSVIDHVHLNNDLLSLNQEKPRGKKKRKSPDPPENDLPTSSKIRRCLQPEESFYDFPEHSNSSWPDMEALIIGCYQIYPLTKPDEQRYIVQLLTAATQYQDLMAPFLERPLHVLQLILQYINLQKQSDVRLAFEALKFLGALLLYKKFATEFISRRDHLRSILSVPHSSLAATGVSFVLFNLSCNDDAMQTVCMLNKDVIKELVDYVLSLIERSHLSGQSHSTVFLGNTFKYKPILKLFDELDGLRKLINLVSTLEVVLPNLGKDVPEIMTPDQVYSSRQLCNQVCHALKVYFEAHAEAKATELRSSTKHSGDSTYAKKSLEENVQTLVELFPPNAMWKPANLLLKLDGIIFLLKLIAMHYDWMYQGKMDTVCSALDVLYICSVVNKVKFALCNEVMYVNHAYAEVKKVGISIVLKTALGDRYNPDVQRSALNVIVNCVCHPIPSEPQDLTTSSKKKHSKNEEDMLNKLFNCVRANDGIFILKSLITNKQPITDADSIRALACQALCGLARSSKVMQILSKLPLITTGQLQVLMREPVLKDKKVEHAKFVKYARLLISMVAGKAVSQSQIDSLMSNIKLAEVVAETIINYDENQLLQIIADHLEKKGLRTSAQCLREEAHLKSKNAERIDSANNAVKAVMGHPHPSPRFSTPKSTKPNSRLKLTLSGSSSPSSMAKWKPPSPGPSTSDSSTRREALRFSEDVSSPSTVIENHVAIPSSSSLPNKTRSVTLHSIVTDYLRNQHAKCDNPFVTCPPFDLFEPHKCPVPHSRYSLPKNIALQMIQKQESPYLWGYNGERRARKYVSCRLREITSYTDQAAIESICSCAFDAFTDRVFIGIYNGQILSFPKVNFDQEAVTVLEAHETFVSNIQTTKYNPIVLTSASWRRPVSALWNIRDGFWDLQQTLTDECYAEFNKLSSERIVATKYERARVYDTSTCEVIYSLCQQNLTNKYSLNRATFNYTDDLILNDGVLWDVRQPSPIHKFDKLNSRFNGIFHPNGLEIVSNTDIWDLRTYRLLKTVPDLEQCQIVFDQPGHIFFGVLNHQDANTKDQSYKRYGTSVRTFDARDYTCIAMRDFFRQIHGIALDYDDRYMALIQNRLMDLRFREESVARIYEIGRTLEEDDDDVRDENDDEEEEEDDDATVILAQSDDDNDDNDNQDQDDDSFDNEGDDDENDNSNDDDDDNDGDDNDDDDDDDNASQHSSAVDVEFISSGSSSSGDHNFVFEAFEF